MTVKEELLKTLSMSREAVKVKCGVIYTDTQQNSNKPIVMQVGGSFDEFLSQLDFSHSDDPDDPNAVAIEGGTVWLEDGSWLKIEWDEINDLGYTIFSYYFAHYRLPQIPKECLPIN
jgi:hypothetical protein